MSPFDALDRAFVPAPDPRRVADLTALPYAHRGLHGSGIVENSRAAFAAAIEAGHGIELDVQANAGGEAFVLHDAELERLTGTAGRVSLLTAAELAAIKLAGTDESLASLSDTLRFIASRVPVLIELKARSRRVSGLCRAVLAALEGYGGPVCVMSFNPEVGHWFARKAPGLTRGMVMTISGKAVIRNPILRRMAFWRAKPDFLAYDIRDLPSPFVAAQRRRGLPILTWTVRTAEERARAAVHADQIIYEMP